MKQVPSYDTLRWTGKANRYALVIPVINEGQRIASLLDKIHALGLSDRIDIIVADGGSTDGSLDPAMLDRNGVKGVLVKTGPGKLSAQLRCAYSFVLDQGYDGVVTIDGNNKDDPVAIPAFMDALDKGIDFAQASRFVRGGKGLNTPWKRLLAIRLIHAPLLSAASGFWWTDTTQGFRAYSRRLLEDPRVAPFRDEFAVYELLAYLNYRAPRLGYRCVELPTVREYPRGEAIPTKIASFSGELGLLKTLLRTCLGGFNPK